MEGNQHSMKAAILRDKKTIILEDIPDPGSPSSFEVRVKILSVGICGSDAHSTEGIGSCYTKFEKSITSSEELIEAIKSKSFTAISK